MKLVDKKEKQIKFKAEIEENLANAIRRHVNQIPILAVQEVEITKNDSPLYDETIAHRIGLIPLKTEKVMNDKTEIKLKLNSKKEGTVYSGELNGGAKIVYEQIPITSLNKGQELEILATARLGKGEDHSKFSPGLMFYRNIVELNIDKDCIKDVVQVCPKNILKVDGGKVIVTDPDECDICEVCVDLCKKQGKDSIKIIPTKDLLITVESFGQIPAQEIVKRSIEILKKNLAEVEKKDIRNIFSSRVHAACPEI